MLVNVEQGSTNPSIATLLRLSDALGVGLPALVDTADDGADAVVIHRDGDAHGDVDDCRLVGPRSWWLAPARRM